MTAPELSDLYITRPAPNTTYHIFDRSNGDRALCRRWMMFRVDPKQCVPVTGKEVYEKGQDCKPCFAKAGLRVDA